MIVAFNLDILSTPIRRQRLPNWIKVRPKCMLYIRNCERDRLNEKNKKMIQHACTVCKNSEGTILISNMTSEKRIMIRNKDDFLVLISQFTRKT